LPALVQSSRRVVVVTALGAESHFEELGRRRRVVTDTRVRIEEGLAKAEGMDAEVLVRTLGGTVGQLGERRLQHVQITDHAPPVELLAVHHDLNPVVMIMELPFWTGHSRHDVESTDVSAQPDLTGHRQHSCRS
jgi:hypothetical protein